MDTKPVTIELRNKEAYTSNPLLEVSAGDWTTNLSSQLTINAGDSIFVKQSFIDTEASSSRQINITEDITLHMEHCYYMMNVGNPVSETTETGGQLTNALGVDPAAAELNVSGGLFLSTVGDRTTLANPTEYAILTVIEFFSKTKSYPSFTVSLQGIGLDNQPFTTSPITIPAAQPKGGGAVLVDIPYKIDTQIQYVTDKGSLSEAQMTALGVFFPNFALIVNLPGSTTDLPKDFLGQISTISETGRYTLERTTTDIKIKKNNYDPTDLCTIINREMNINKPPVAIDYAQTQFLRKTPLVAIITPTPDTGTFFVENDPVEGDANIGIVKGAQWFYGSSKVLLDFNVTQGLFSFTYAHTPFYYQGAESTAYMRSSDEIGQEEDSVYTVDRLGGTLFTSLTASSDRFGTRYDFWGKTMGFEVALGAPNSMCVSPTLIDSGGTSIPHIPNLELGINMIGNFTGADSLIAKSSSDTTYTFRLYTPPVKYTEVADVQFNTSTYTTPILAPVAIFQQNNSFGYYLLEIDTNFESQYLDNTSTNKKIKSVVSRFFERASYTAGSSDGSLIYTHQGAPQLLSSFSCRVLTSDKVLATNVGIDNTIFLQLQRAVPAPTPPPSKDSKD